MIAVPKYHCTLNAKGQPKITNHLKLNLSTPHLTTMKRIILILTFVLAALNVSTTTASNVEAEIALIKSRYRNFYAEKAPEEATIKQYLDSIDLKTGAWCDIDYASTIGSGWRTKEHTRRTMCIAQFYSKGKDTKTTLFSQQDLIDAVHSAWGYWFRERPHCPTNWYPNVLSCPHELGISFMLMQEEMSQEESVNAVALVFKKSRLQKTGSNLIYVANTALMQGLFQRDTALIRRAIDAVSSTIYIAEKGQEAIQSDYSYHLHGAQQQMGNYGREAIISLAPFCEVLTGTSFDFSDTQKDILLGLITQGFRWFMWEGYLDMNGSGRQYGPDMFKYKGGTILEASARIAKAGTPQQQRDVEAMIKENSGGGKTTLVGQKHFDKSDCFISRAEDWVTSLRMHSTRVRATEMSTNDNRRGFFAPDGSLFTYVDGGDYENASALWDWSKVPGITCYESDNPLIVNPFATGGGRNIANKSNFVGACTNGTHGIASMILDKDKQLYRKSWVVTPEFILCVGSDLHEASGKSPLTTSVEQRLLDGELAILRGKKWSCVDDKVVISQQGLRLHHHKSGYIILDDNECEASVESRSGNWTDVTYGLDPLSVSGKMVSIFVRHKGQPSSYKYLILPNKSRVEVARFDTSTIDVITNSRDLHLICCDGQYYATAYSSGRYKVNKKLSIDVKRAGIYMFKRDAKGWHIIAHDPTKEISDSAMKSQIEIID